MIAAELPADDEAERASLSRDITYARRVAELHVKYYRRLSLYLRLLALLSLCSPLFKLMGGEDKALALFAVVFFFVMQGADWIVAPGEKAGEHAALAKEWQALLTKAPRLKVENLKRMYDELCNNDVHEIEAVRHVAFVSNAREQGYFTELPDEDRKLSTWQHFVDCVFLF